MDNGLFCAPELVGNAVSCLYCPSSCVRHLWAVECTLVDTSRLREEMRNLVGLHEEAGAAVGPVDLCDERLVEADQD